MSCSLSKKNPLYGNIRVEAPDGSHLFNCGAKKKRWYIVRNLAVVIQEDPSIIRLTFEPKARGRADDPFYLQARANICVCCGTDRDLTRHHIIPLMYRRYFPEELKSHTSHDVLPVCLDCHSKYEVHADKFKIELLNEVGEKHISQIYASDEALNTVVSAASAILKYQDVMPPERCVELAEIVRSYFGGPELTRDMLARAVARTHNIKVERTDGERVVEKLVDVDEFIRRWRQHFLEYAEAKFMPAFWDVDRVERISI